MRKTFSVIVLMMLAPFVQADVFKWVDRDGRVHYSDSPPENARSRVLDLRFAGGATDTNADPCCLSKEDPRVPENQPVQIVFAAEPPVLQPATRGMDFGVYIMLRAGMSEGELLQRAGPPDFQTYDGSVGVSVVGKARRINDPAGNRVRGPRVHTFSNLEVKRYYYYPTVSNPFTTVLTLTGGMISDLQRTRRF